MTGSKLTLTMLLATFATVACGVSANQSKAAHNSGDENAESQEFPKAQTAANDDMPVGSELTLCDGCPTFVKVPAAPDNLRRIEYVSKYELTWKNYGASVRDGGCEAPTPKETRNFSPVPKIEESLFDWPIKILHVDEIECYTNWLSKKSGKKHVIPSEAEWEWFALAGATTLYPWGNEPDITKAAVKGSIVARKDHTPPTLRLNRHIYSGIRVGLFPPNNWGLHDIMGNSYELTSTRISGEERLRRNPNSKFALRTRDRETLVLKGSAWYVDDLPKTGVKYKRYSLIYDGDLLARPAIRIVILGDEN